MADESVTYDEMGGLEPPLRPCSFCGTEIHASSHRCVTCGGHVGISWGVVHKELFLFLLASILIGIGCLASWATRSPTRDFPAMNGLLTIRGSIMLALSIYGVASAYFSILNRKMVVWPFLLNALLALWLGLPAVSSAINGTEWNAWKQLADTSGGSMMDKWFGGLRAIPPGILLLTIGGLLVAISILKGIVGGFVSGSAKAKAAQAEGSVKGAARRRGARASSEPTPIAGDPVAGDPGHDTGGA